MADRSSSSLVSRKREMRRALCARREALVPAERERRARALADIAVASPELAGARVVAGYIAVRAEIDPAPALARLRARGAVVVFPRITTRTPRLRFLAARSPDDVRAGAWDLREPHDGCAEVPAHAIDVVLVPGVAFDARGGRLGYGGGYYDELIASVGARPRPRFVGVAFDFQIVPACPRDARDAAVAVVLTDARSLIGASYRK